MKYIKTKDAIPGGMCAKSIYNVDNVLLMNANSILNKKKIELLKKYNVTGYCIYEKPEDLSSESKRFDLLDKGSINCDDAVYLANNIVNLLTDGIAEQEILNLTDYDRYTSMHCVNVAVYSVLIGIGLGYNNQELQDLCLAALMHDIGKMKISKEIICKASNLTDEEYAIVKEHPIFGYELCKAFKLSDKVAKGALEHHENEDGTGYPYGKSGKEISEFAKIIHIADVYDAMISKRSYKSKIECSEVIEYLYANCGSKFDIEICKVFLKYLEPYPVGSEVVLSNNKTAKVIKTNHDCILRPVVELENSKIDLSKKHFNLTILSVD